MGGSISKLGVGPETGIPLPPDFRSNGVGVRTTVPFDVTIDADLRRSGAGDLTSGMEWRCGDIFGDVDGDGTRSGIVGEYARPLDMPGV